MHHSHTFEGVAPEDVFRQFTDPEFLSAFSEEVGVRAAGLTTSENGGVLVADMPWQFSTRKPGIPSLAQKFLPDEVSLDWHQEWGPLSAPPVPGVIRVALHGKPSADVRATTSLSSSGSGTVYRADTKTKTSLRWPVASTVEQTIDKELVGWILRVQARVLRRRMGLPAIPE